LLSLELQIFLIFSQHVHNIKASERTLRLNGLFSSIRCLWKNPIVNIQYLKNKKIYFVFFLLFDKKMKLKKKKKDFSVEKVRGLYNKTSILVSHFKENLACQARMCPNIILFSSHFHSGKWLHPLNWGGR